MVFARKTDDALASLVKQIERVVSENSEQKVASFVNILGRDEQATQKAARRFVDEHQVRNVAIVVPKDHENGPPSLKISPDADVTVMLYRDTTVKANHSMVTGGLTEEKIAAIMADAETILE